METHPLATKTHHDGTSQTEVSPYDLKQVTVAAATVETVDAVVVRFLVK